MRRSGQRLRCWGAPPSLVVRDVGRFLAVVVARSIQLGNLHVDPVCGQPCAHPVARWVTQYIGDDIAQRVHVAVGRLAALGAIGRLHEAVARVAGQEVAAADGLAAVVLAQRVDGFKRWLQVRHWGLQ
jgi:hypothetical protein